MLRRLRRFLALKPMDRRIVLRAAIWLPGMDLALRVRGFQWLIQHAPTARPAQGGVQPEAVERARRYSRWLAAVSRHHIARARCLQRSLVLHYWLRQEGLPSELRIGVQRAGDGILGHAWVELDGQVVTDAPSAIAHFAPLIGLKAERAVLGRRQAPFSRHELSSIGLEGER